MGSFRYSSARREAGEGAARGFSERTIAARSRVLRQDLKFLHVRQEGSDMPGDGEDFPRIVLQGRRFLIPSVHVYFAAGTFTVRLKYDGSAIAENLTNATAYPYFFTNQVVYEADKFITVAVTSSDSVEEFEAIFTLVPV